MKKHLLFIILASLAIQLSAQKNITHFLGIPVDGTKTAMIQKLKAKGFTYNLHTDNLQGEFNGSNVTISILTNNNKVYRIAVEQPLGTSERNAIIKFNKLCNQFKNNDKYIVQDPTREYLIDGDVDISYQITVKDKRYEAGFFQISETDTDTTGLYLWALDYIKDTYTEDEWQKIAESQDSLVFETIKIGITYMYQKVSHKSVWFMLSHNLMGYSILLFYDNELNAANGEDL